MRQQTGRVLPEQMGTLRPRRGDPTEGLRGFADRVEALGGALTVESRPAHDDHRRVLAVLAYLGS